MRNALVLLVLCVVAASFVLSSVSAKHASTIDTPSRLQFHTSSGALEAGCARSQLYEVPASFDQDGNSLRLGFTLNVTVQRFAQTPVISAQNAPGTPGASQFDYCYNSAYVPLYSTSGEFESHALLVRCQNLLDSRVPYAVGPSYLVLAVDASGAAGSQVFEPISKENVVFEPTLPYENYGVEDPRVVYDSASGMYYLFYSAVATMPWHAPDVMSRLSLATTRDPRNISAWVKQGPIVKNNDTYDPSKDPDDPLAAFAWSKSGALLKAAPGQKSLLIFGDSSIENGVQTAEPAEDFMSYSYNSSLFLPIRSDNFDSNLVEAGPPPLTLANGLRFFIYNSARLGYPSAKPGWNTQYNVGFALLDSLDPDTILLRSDNPILSPELGWEIGTEPWLGLTPNVVFVEGARLANEGGSNEKQAAGATSDRIIAWYGAADSTVGAAVITVEYTEAPATSSRAAKHQQAKRIALE